MSQIVTLYSDKERTDALYPRTKVSAISDDSNTPLKELMTGMVKQDEGGAEEEVVTPINADTLGGKLTANNVVFYEEEMVDEFGQVVVKNADKLNNKDGNYYDYRNSTLTLEEIQATTDLTGKIASASALNHLNTYKLNGRLKAYSQRDSNIILSFRGNILTRALAGFIVISGQRGITEPISFSFVGNGIYEDISQWEAIVCSNSYGIAGRDNGKIYIPANIGSGWGYVNIILLKDNLDFSISYE